MNFQIHKAIPPKDVENLVLFIFQGKLTKEIVDFDKKSEGKISHLIEEEKFIAKCGEIISAPKMYLGDKRLFVIGLGETKKMSLESLKIQVGKMAKFLQSKKFHNYTLVFPKSIFVRLNVQHLITAIITSITTATYHFSKFLSDDEQKQKSPSDISVVLFSNASSEKIQRIVKEAIIIGDAINYTRDLGNLPPLEMTPTYMAHEAEKLHSAHKRLTVKILGKTEMKKEKMGGLLGVSLGSDEEPKFIIMEWMNAPKNAGTYVFVGKAITFDSGGLSLKPSEKMDEMKFDMLGGGTVMGAIKAIAELHLKVNLVALIPATENLPSGKAYRPGDILRARNGKTIEVLNTDAEGRIILADALSYASDYKPKFVLDIATLTGAVLVALGEKYAGLFTHIQSYKNSIQKIARQTAEPMWHLPLDDEFVDQIKSNVADVRNIGKTKWAGSSTAAAFLEQFTTYPWAHLDIAGVGWSDEKPYRHAGATGYGVHLLIELAKYFSEK